MKPVQTQEVQELLCELAKATPFRQDLIEAAVDMIGRLEVEKAEKKQAVYFAVLDEMSQANVNVSEYESDSLREENEALRTVLKTIL
ncbi:hypothetical protein MKX72_20215 [Priestia sp. FSL R5-0597]|uniref:hypothetical protein n=1 Tax=Priestia sp. FSL R5-0597 TaxID=2921580 RepID=UPI0030F6508B